MSYSNQRPVLLSSRETYEIYEKRTVSPQRPTQGGYSYSPAPTQPLPPARTVSGVQHTSGTAIGSAAGAGVRPGQPFCGGPYVYNPPKSHSPSVHFNDSVNVEHQGAVPQDRRFGGAAGPASHNSVTERITTMFPSLQKTGKFPIGWIVCVAVSVPIFVVIVLFAAVWLQELGML